MFSQLNQESTTLSSQLVPGSLSLSPRGQTGVWATTPARVYKGARIQTPVPLPGMASTWTCCLSAPDRNVFLAALEVKREWGPGLQSPHGSRLPSITWLGRKVRGPHGPVIKTLIVNGGSSQWSEHLPRLLSSNSINSGARVAACELGRVHKHWVPGK